LQEEKRGINAGKWVFSRYLWRKVFGKREDSVIFRQCKICLKGKWLLLFYEGYLKPGVISRTLASSSLRIGPLSPDLLLWSMISGGKDLPFSSGTKKRELHLY
jgi:hypothetical protein